MKGLQVWLMNNFDDIQIEEQFLVLKNEIVSNTLDKPAEVNE
ncbi:hypothetical protein [Staphylococcus lloydii]|nr:hypothetical protein [Staphylococcus lloydii]